MGNPSLRKARARVLNHETNMRYSVALMLFVLMASALTIGVVGGVNEDAAAQKEYSRSYSEQYTYSSQQSTTQKSSNGNANKSVNGNSANTQDSSRPSQNQTEPTQQEGAQQNAPAQTAPAQPTQQSSTAPAAPTTPVAPAAPAQNVRQTPVRTVRPAPVKAAQEPAQPAITDTAPAIAQMTNAQATAESKPVTYTSQQISDATRNRLIVLSAIAIATGIVMYLLTLFGGSASPISLSSTRYKISVREG